MFSDFVPVSEAQQRQHAKDVRDRLNKRPAMLLYMPVQSVVDNPNPPTETTPKPVDNPRAKAVYNHSLAPAIALQIWRDIVEEVAIKHEVTFNDIISQRRNVKIVAARHEAMYRLREETPASYPRIGKWLGDRDHTTVLHGVEMHIKRMSNPPPVTRPPRRVHSPRWPEERRKDAMDLLRFHSTAAVAKKMGCSKASIAGLLRRYKAK